MKKSHKTICLIFTLLLLTLGTVYSLDTGIQVVSKFEKVEVFVNNHTVGFTHKDEFTGQNILRVPLKPGKYTVKCKYHGYEPWTKQVTVSTGFVQIKPRFQKVKTEAKSINTYTGTAKSKVGIIKIFSNPSGAYVRVDGETQDAPTDCIIRTSTGTHKIEVYFPHKKTISIAPFYLPAGNPIKIKVDFYKSTYTIDIKYTVTINSSPQGAYLYIDGKKMGKTPQTLKLTYGVHTIKIKKSGYITLHKTFHIKNNDFLTLRLVQPTYIKTDTKMVSKKVKINGTTIGRTPLKTTEIPAGENRIEIDNISLNYNFKPYHLYKISLDTKWKEKPLYKTAKGLPGYKPLPPKPSLLPRYAPSDPLMKFGASALMGGLGGALATALVEGEDEKTTVFWGGTIVFTLVLFFTLPDSPRIEKNIKENNKRLARWREEKKPIEAYNRKLLKTANEKIQEYNKKVLEHNKTLLNIQDLGPYKTF